MSTVDEIYTESIRLSPADRLRLATLIMEGLAEQVRPSPSVVLAEFLETLPPGPRAFPSWEEYERRLAEERDAWDR